MSSGKVGYAAVRIEYSNIDEALLRTAMASVRKGGRLDVVVSPCPPTIAAAEEVTRKLYGYAPPSPSELDFTVLLSEPAHAPKWELVITNTDGNDADATFNDSQKDKQTSRSDLLEKYEIVAAGGTWDHMHWGHRLMLTLTAYTAKSTVVLGVTSSKLLVNKKFAEALESYETREQSAVAFVKYLRPDVTVHTYALEDMYGPTVIVKEIEALVVSAETSAGGAQVNEKRKEMGWPSLDVIEVGLISSDSNAKLSSTDFRRAEVQLKGNL